MRALPREKVKTAFPGRIPATLIYLLHNKSPDYNSEWLFCVVEPGVLLGETELQQLSLVPHHRGAETCISHFSSLNVAISAHSHLHSLKYVDLDDGCPSKDST